ncbi:hypothetical protein LCGC14_2165690 [marine sediment metagenome]|uniref:Uncharacterized protein n=1 Tax=marine sediment metagenome TaxID=412755 RepID=A0A0F9DRL5_9ZZZZ
MSYKPAVYVYQLKRNGKITEVPNTSWAQINGAMDAIQSFLFHASEGDKIEIEITKMNWQEFEKLPEYRGVLK